LSAEDPREIAVSEDGLLGGAIRLRQSRAGYRAAIDPVFLAAAVPAEAGETVLDAGCGAGAASLCLAKRVPDCRITGIEAQRDLVRLANENATLNGFADRIVIMTGDILRPPPRLEPGSFSHVMANPPYLAEDAGTPPPDAAKAAATLEGAADLAAWLRFALSAVRAKGSVTFIHRADRMEQLLAQLSQRAGEIVVFPLWPGQNKPAKRIIVRARKGVATPTRLTPGLVLHEADGRYTAAAEAILRHGAALAF
jgi:tRNA1(Val) A37 N6-methylase TrmN6